MATVLNLFPARIRFVNEDGTLSPEAYRALQSLMVRVGGPLGDNGVDVFGDLTGAGSQDASFTDTVTQSIAQPVMLETTTQPVSPALFLPDIQQPTFQEAGMSDIFQPCAIGINGTITTASLVGKTVTIQNGIIISIL